MGKFIQFPQVKKIREPNFGRAEWELTTDLIYEDSKSRVWTVPAGFVTDFASVPRAPLMYWFAGDHAHMSAILHDYLCREIYPDQMTWKEAADIFYEAMQAERVSSFRRRIMYWAVRFFGEGFNDRKKD